MSPHPNTERERAVDRQRTSRRRLGIAVMAFIVCVVPTACGYAAAAAPPKNPTPTATASGQGGGHTGHGGTATPTPTPPAPGGNQGGGNQGGGNQGGGNQGGGNQGGGNQGGGKPTPTATPAPTTDAPKPPPPGNQNPPPDNGLDVLGRDCTESDLTPHTGFQIAPACVGTAFGEVAAEGKSPSLLITEAPDSVPVGQAFTLSVSTRNLVRDRFLGAAAGGYYLESSFLDENGLQRGHFHTACRMLQSTSAAPDAAPAPEFFLATQDNGGGAQPDTVVVTVTGMPAKGTAQCTSWAGDGSHRIPMMQRANQTPAVDSVRITVT